MLFILLKSIFNSIQLIMQPKLNRLYNLIEPFIHQGSDPHESFDDD